MSALYSLIDNGPAEPDDGTQTNLGANPMQRAYDQRMSDPASVVQQGIAHLNDPNNGLSSEQKMAAIVPLLQAKHFGGNGPASQGQVAAPQSQMNQGVFGFLGKLTGGMKAGAAIAAL